MSVDVVIEDTRWTTLDALANAAVPAALAGLSPGWEVAILGCDDTRIAALNAEFRGKSVPTNVLSWPSEKRHPDRAPQDLELGDIAIAYDTCLREAAAQHKDFDAHVTHLLVHGTLHLLGHDHIDDEGAARMEALEIQILRTLGFPDPYADDTLNPAAL